MLPQTSTLPHSLPEISGYNLVEQLYLSSRTVVYRAVQVSEQRPVVIKMLRREYPSFSELVQFRNQYAIAKNFPIPGIVRPLSLEPMGSGYALVMEDWGGVALGKYSQQGVLDLVEILEIAIQIAEILHDLHQHRIVHKDIKPANILIQPESKQIKLIDFSIASLLPKETQEIQSPNILEGTLAYLAPEQTGRMNRGIDYRADFYAFGITLYQLLTGTLPFTSTDPLELIHCHIAKVPVLVNQVNPEVPTMVAAIVSKLMAKNAEDRYQSALGLKHDLAQCLVQWKATGEIPDFELGQQDVSDRFLIPEKLYGRETEVQTLLAAFDRVAKGASELMLVAGFSGIGKTAVINEVHKPIVRQRGYFIKGKFDQFNRDIPLSAFVQALRDLIGQLLSESDEQLIQWRTKILAAVGENGQILIEVIPELEQVIGKQPIAPELAGSAVQNRFNLLFQKFIGVFTTAEHPLVLFLDDLQWADSASLQLIKLLMSDSRYLLMLGAYRDNEMSPVHPLMLGVEGLKKASAIVHTMTLAPLAFEDTAHLVADTLNCSREVAQPLTELIHHKTQGNPFFITQFLKALYEDGQIRFIPPQSSPEAEGRKGGWTCDIAQVKALSLTDDVVEFMALQLQKLPLETQRVIQLAACIGNHFDLVTLAIVSEQSQEEAATHLWKALQEGLILPTSQVYKFFQDASFVTSHSSLVDPPTGSQLTDDKGQRTVSYKFLHDRVQQAAYSLIPEHQRSTIHYRIGRLLLNHLSSATQDDQIFEIVSHLNPGSGLITDSAERVELARLNLLAGRKAMSSIAYTAALMYLNAGIALLPDDAWRHHYPLTLALHHSRLDAAYFNTKFAELEEWCELVLQQATSVYDRIKAYEVLVQVRIAQDRQVEAIQIGLDALSQLQVSLVSIDLSDRSSLDQLPRLEIFPVIADMVDPAYRAALRMLATITPPVHHVKPDLYPSVALTMLHLCLEHGHSSDAAFVYGCYSVLFWAVVGDLDVAYRACQVGLKLLEYYPDKAVSCKVYMIFGVFICACKEPSPVSLNFLRQAIQVGQDVGDLEHVSYSMMAEASFLPFLEDNLDSVLDKQIQYLHFLQKAKQKHILDYLNIWHDLVICLTGSLSSDNDLLASRLEDVEFLAYLQSTHNHQSLFALHLAKTVKSYLFKQPELAVAQALEAAKYADGAFGFLLVAIHNFYTSLALLAQYYACSEQEQAQTLQTVEQNQQRMSYWASCAPSNFQHKYDLVEAEKNRIIGDFTQAIVGYDRAISGANANGYILEEALANELAAKFYLNWGKEKVAASYLQDAYYNYAHWGAKAKIQDLECRYPSLLAPILQQQHTTLLPTETVFASASLMSGPTSSTQSSSSGSTSVSTTLDLATILKVSQTLSSEIQLDKLLAVLLHTVLENAGADKGALLMQHQHQWFVEAIATIDQPVQVRSMALSDCPELSHSVVNSVKRSLQPSVIVDAAVHPTLATDAYIVQQQPKSILCTPILRQGEPVAILYLENRCTVGAFTRDRVELLNLLCAQAAISLENARLYRQAQTDAQQIEQSLKQLRVSEARFQKLAGNIPGLIYQIRIQADGSASTAYVSSGCQTLYEVTAADLMSGKYSLRDFEHPDDQAGVLQAVIKAAQTLTPFRYEWRIITPNGTIKWVQAASQPERTENGEVVFDGVLIDVTDRKQIEAEQTRLLAILENTSDFIGSADPMGKILYLNQAWRNLLNLADVEAAKELGIAQQYPAWAFEIIANQALPKAIHSGMWVGETAILDDAGREIPVSQVVIAHKASNGEVEYFSTILRDISDRKQAEASMMKKSQELAQALQEIQRKEAQSRGIFEAVSDGLLVTDLETGKVIDANPAYYQLHGYSYSEILSLHPLDFIPLSHHDKFADFLNTVKAGRSFTCEAICKKRDGTPFYIELTSVPFSYNGKRCGLSVIRDVTERKHMELSIQEKNRKLEQTMTELQYAQMQMIQSEKMSALGNLVAGVAHEINNPIGFLNGSINNAKDYVQDLLKHLVLYQQHHPNPALPVQDHADEIDLEFLSEDLPKLLNSMQGASDRIKSISTSLRTFSRADTEHKVSANLHEGLDSTLLILKYRLKANQQRPEITVIRDYGELPPIECFPGQLNQVFMNILANAIDALDEVAQQSSFDELQANPQIITIQTRLTQQNAIEIRIGDNGGGMSEAVKAKIFDHLFTTKAVGKGTGLGLAIARQIVVEKHGGILEVQSQLGQGTEFLIHLATDG